MRWSLWGQKNEAVLLQSRPGSSENVVQHPAGRHNIEIQVTYDGLSWGEYSGDPRALLLFTIHFIQPSRAILKDTEITFSFDCHPTEEDCHTSAGQNGCQNALEERKRGVVDVSAPSTLCGTRVGRDITRQSGWEAAPNLEIASLGAVTLGHIQGETGYTQHMERNWIFTSRVAPPRKFNTFNKHTDVSCAWKHNEYDITLYPSSIKLGVIVDCGEAHALPLTLSIDGSLGGAFKYFSKLKYHEKSIAISRKLGDLDPLDQQIERLTLQADAPTV